MVTVEGTAIALFICILIIGMFVIGCFGLLIENIAIKYNKWKTSRLNKQTAANNLKRSIPQDGVVQEVTIKLFVDEVEQSTQPEQPVDLRELVFNTDTMLHEYEYERRSREEEHRQSLNRETYV